MSRNAIDITGKRFGRLTAICCAGHQNERVIWKFRCDCGTECVALKGNVMSGNTRSCGCLYKETRANRWKKKER